MQVQVSNISINFVLILCYSYCYTSSCYFLFHNTTHRGLKIMLILTSFPSDLFQRYLDVILIPDGDVSRILVASRMEFLVELLYSFQFLTYVTVSSVLFNVGVLDQHLLGLHHFSIRYLYRVYYYYCCCCYFFFHIFLSF